jgi:hypothetical protein
LTSAGKKFHKESKEKKPIKIRLEIKISIFWVFVISWKQ